MNKDIRELLSSTSLARESKTKSFVGKKIVIYGAGVNGKWVYEKLKDVKVNVGAFLDDTHFQVVNNISVLTEKEFAESDFCGKDTLVILSFYIKNEDILQDIKNKLICSGIRNENIYHFVELFMDEYFESEKITNQTEVIADAYSLLADDKSKDTFYSYIEAIIKHDSAFFIQPSDQIQYFDKEITVLSNNYIENGYFVDCGAYIGDTFKSFKEQGLKMNYIGFEPDINNFNLLAQEIAVYKEEYKSIIFPCATSKVNTLVGFSYSNEKSHSPGSSISSMGNVMLPCIALDAVIGGLGISFIKMDIEGAEYESLLGARMIIERTHPDLAICTYHKTEDVWNLINLIHSFYSGYRFYLRSYYLYSRETVLYALNIF